MKANTELSSLMRIFSLCTSIPCYYFDFDSKVMHSDGGEVTLLRDPLGVV